MSRTASRAWSSRSAVFSVAALALALPAAAQTFSVSGPGGSIPASGTGGGGAPIYPSVFPTTPFTSTVDVNVTVDQVCRVKIDGLQHTWIGDMQIVLLDPTGKGTTLMARPGFDSAGAFGNGGERTFGLYEFIETGGLQVPDSAFTDMPPGTYDQHFGDPNGVAWPDGLHNIFNTGLSQVSGPPGTWTLKIWDWAAGDTGSCTGWTLEGNGNCVPPPPAPTIYCTAKTTSNGCIPSIAANGVASATTGNGFLVTGWRVRNHKAGTLLYSLTGTANVPFQGGILCVKSPTRRTPPIKTYGSALPANDCTGVFTIDMNAFAVGALGGTPEPALAVPGTLVNCQWWGRDPGFAWPNNSLLSNALEYTVGS